jgi:large subunit ribosomal protein L9
MQVILLERLGRLGQMGDVVTVKDGFARNFLLPQGKALRATDANRRHFEGQRAQLEAHDLEAKTEAEAVAEKLNGESFIVIRQAGDNGQLYGSVSTRDIATAVTEGGFTIDRRQVLLPRPIKMLGLHEVRVALHGEVSPQVTVNVARSPEEAERQARGEDVTRAKTEEEEDAEDARLAAEHAREAGEALFEEGEASEENTDVAEGEQEAEKDAKKDAAS